MARVVRKKKRKLKKIVLVSLLAVIAFFSFMFKSLVLTTLSTKYAIEIQKKELEIADINDTIQGVKNDINVLSNKDRIYQIATQAGLTIDKDNLTYINNFPEY